MGDMFEDHQWMSKTKDSTEAKKHPVLCIHGSMCEILPTSW